MAITLFRETKDSRAVRYGSNDGGEVLKFILGQSFDQVEVTAYVVNNTTPTWDGFIRNLVTPTPLGGGFWDISVEYGKAGLAGGSVPVGVAPTPPQAPGGEQGSSSPGAEDEPLGAGYDFNLTVDTVHITQDIATAAAFLRGAALVGPNNTSTNPPAPETDGVIGLSDKGVEGCDIWGCKLEWGRQVSRDIVTRKYINQLRRIVGKKNNRPFYTAAAGEVLYLGASGQHTDGKWALHHKFWEIENQTDIVICDGLTIPFKYGWDYLDILYEIAERGNRKVEVPHAAYVRKVIEDADFAFIDIGEVAGP